MKSPGISTVSSGIKVSRHPHSPIKGAFCGRFSKGPINQPLPITSVQELVLHFGEPDNENFNDFYQVYNFLEHYPGIYVVRTADSNQFLDIEVAFSKQFKFDEVESVNSFNLSSSNDFNFTTEQISYLRSSFSLYDRFTIEGENYLNGCVYTVVDTENFDFVPRLTRNISKHDRILKINGLTTSSIEIPSQENYEKTDTNDDIGVPSYQQLITNLVRFELEKYNYKQNDVSSIMTIWAKSPGLWGDSIDVAFVLREDFQTTSTPTNKTIFDISVEQIFGNTIPQEDEIGIAIAVQGKVQEAFISKIDMIDQTINGRSKYIIVKTRPNVSYYSTASSSTLRGGTFRLLGGRDGISKPHNLLESYDIFKDKEKYQIDVVIANEFDNGLGAITLAEARRDIICFAGAPTNIFNYNNETHILDELIEWRSKAFYAHDEIYASNHPANAPVNSSSYVVLIGSAMRIYDTFNNRLRHVNIAGAVAGLRCAANSSEGEWCASAGVHRGLIGASDLLIYKPEQHIRDVLYSHNINPVITVNNYGTVFWGNRTLAPVEDPLSSIHVRSLTNMMIRSLESLLQQFLFQNIDHFTIASVQGAIKPFLTKIKAAGGLDDFYVSCDIAESTTGMSNTLNVQVFYKPTGVAEYITIRFVNTGSSELKVTQG